MIKAILDRKVHPPPQLTTIIPRIVEAPSTYASVTIGELPTLPQTQNYHRTTSLQSITDWSPTSSSESIWPEFLVLPRELEVTEFEMDRWVNEVLEGIVESDAWESLSSSAIVEVEKEIFPDGWHSAEMMNRD